ncbi:MAG: EamA family transporter RarD [Gammaproteobacteria bacterium]|nr:EamA family transporter RarD [Gammaproteobacteria bacterium]
MNWGVAYALGAYLLWGLFPLYFKALISVPPLQILAHRMVWSLVLLTLVLLVKRHFTWLRAVRERPSIVARFALSAFLLANNWGLYIWAINTGHVVDASLGYYINPLMSVVVGAVALSERLRPAQWIAVAIAAGGVAWMAIVAGHLPWIALSLALSFALYGLMRKTAPLGSLEGLTLETAALLPLALAYLAWEGSHGADAFLRGGWGLRLALMAAGPVTAIPLLLFAAAARRIPLSLLGILQYLMPTVVLALGVWLYHESFGRDRAIGFGLVWGGVVLYLGDALWRSRKTPYAAPASSNHSRKDSA